MRFDNLVSVSQAQLDAAYKKIIALDNSAEELEALVSREFWQAFIAHKYRSQFEAHRQPFQDRQGALDDSYSANKLSFAAYERKSKALQQSLAIEEAKLIEKLSRQELHEHSTHKTGEKASGATE